MPRRTLIIAALAACAVMPAAATPAVAASSCSALAPASLSVAPRSAGTAVTVRWRVPRRHPAGLAFRVARNGAVVGQTRGRSMRIRVAPGRGARISVTAVVGGRATRCRATIRVERRAAVGGGPGSMWSPTTTPRGGRTVTLAWQPPVRRTRPVTSFWVLRDGQVLRRTGRRSITIRMRRRSQRIQIAAVDRAGRVGPPSRPVVVKAGHVPPSAPQAPALSAVAGGSAVLSWRPSRAYGSKVMGYRVLRDGRPLRSVHGTRVRLTGLGAAGSPSYRVIAIDSLGWTSRASQPVRIAPRPPAAPVAHQPPAAPGAPGATSVTDTALSLTWSPAASAGTSALRGYRVMRDGVVVAQVPTAQAQIGNLAPKSAHDWTVAAVDALGYVSPPSPVTRIVQADPPPSTGRVHAYLLASTDASFAAFRTHYQRVAVVYPTFYDCAPGGEPTGSNDPLIVGYAQDRKVKVLPRFNCQNTARLHRILTEPALRARWLDIVTALADEHGWDGVNIDFEAVAAADRDALTAFIADLSERLHARGKLLSQAVSAKTSDVPNHPRSTAFDYPELAKYNDIVFVMAWGIHWATSAPGPQDDYVWVKQVRDYVATMPEQHKFVMGTMLYAMDWPSGGGATHPGTALHYAEVQALIDRYGVSPQYDAERDSWHLAYTDEAGTPHDVWYSDAATVGNRVALARERGLQVGFWRIGQEDERIWSDARLP